MDLGRLKQAPFNLDAAALAWVEATFKALDTDAKAAQVMVPLARDLKPAALDEMLRYGVGGVARLPSSGVEALRDSAEYVQRKSKVPALMPVDIEFSERSSVRDGTCFPNQLAIAATDDPEWGRRMGLLAGREGGYCGFNVTWTPVVDIDFNHRSTIVNTRSFGSDTDKLIAFATAYLRGVREAGFPGAAKHFPGDGMDPRDQHFVTTHNSLDMKAWRETYGRVYKAVIAEGVACIMPGHITLAAYNRELGSAAKSPELMPATLNADLLLGLLRGELGYNGLIVSDATGMAGFKARGVRADLVPMCIENGCDILLFPEDVKEDFGYLKQGLATGKLSPARLDDAVLRILALKASLGLHLSTQLPERERAEEIFGSKEHLLWARQASEAAVTLVKDTQKLLPLDPKRHRRLLVSRLERRMGPSGQMPDLIVPDLLTKLGFETTFYTPGMPIDPARYDAGLYLLAEEGTSGKGLLHPHWEELHGLFPFSMDRLWHVMPTAFVSFGTPYHLHDAPDVRTFVNAYSAVVPMQEAVVKALTGELPFKGVSPVDPFCGLEDARL